MLFIEERPTVKNINTRKTTLQFIQEATARHYGMYQYHRSAYVNAHTKVEIYCPVHDLYFWQLAREHCTGQGCPKCGITRHAKSKTRTLEEFLKLANARHGVGRYHYDRTVYKGSKDLVEIYCPVHDHYFWQTAENHINGSGCQKCGGNHRMDTDEFIRRSNDVHGEGKYDYRETVYKTSIKKVKIFCNVHQKFFWQRADHHMRGIGCPMCAGRDMGTDKFIERSVLIHGDTYGYDKTEYKNPLTKVMIYCKRHQEYFWQMPYSHMKGCGCRKCARDIFVSKPETEWLDHLGIPLEWRQYPIETSDRFFVVDGFDPVTNTVYEFDGDLWHGNPEFYAPTDLNPFSKRPYGELYRETIERRNALNEMGYDVVSIWESEWKSVRR